MKKLFLVAAITAIGFAANAQVAFGVKAGLNLSNLKGDGESLDSKAGFNAGGFATIPVSSMFAVQPEILFSVEGAKQDEIKYNLNYINIPVMFQYRNSGFIGELGPQIGILASAKAKLDDETADIKDGFKSTNFALVIGAGYQLTNGLGFGVRYNLGLSSIAEDSDAEIKTSTFSVGASFSFGGKKSSE